MKRRFAIAIPIIIFGALVFVSPAGAQRGIGAKSAPVGRAAIGGSFGIGGRRAFRFAHPLHPIFRGRGSGWGLGWGYLPYPDYYDYSDYEPAMTEAPPWESAALPSPAGPPEREIHPILLERQGDQWVQVTGYSHAPAPAQSAPRMQWKRRVCAPVCRAAPKLPNPLASFPRPYWCFATGMRKRSKATRSSVTPCTREGIIGSVARGQERSRLPTWMFPPPLS